MIKETIEYDDVYDNYGEPASDEYKKDCAEFDAMYEVYLALEAESEMDDIFDMMVEKFGKQEKN